MTQYNSNRQRQLKIGITSYTEGKNVLDVIGNALITGITTINNNLTVDSGTLYVDSVNNRVGVGTVSPTTSLDVSGDIKVGVNTSQGLIMTSPNGTKYRLFIGDSGELLTTLVT